jgi:hypothetical protein
MDPNDNPGGGPAADDPAAPLAPDAMTTLAEAMANLAHISAMSLANNLSKAKAVQKPSPFKGEHGSDARRFLAAYDMWATAQGTALNTVDREGNPVARKEMEWIRAALSYLQDDASIWAAPSMEIFASGGVPFDGLWETFRAQFKARFETVDEAVDAKEKLRVLWQGKTTVPKYAAQFKEYMMRTGYSATDLRDRFYDHLTSTIKDELVHTARPNDTLDSLILVATDLDVRIRQRQSEKEREEKRYGAGKGAVMPTPTRSTPFVPPAADPTAMEVDATHTREEFIRRMKGKCFGCGSVAHNKRDGNHEREICTYCRRVGHRDVVCFDKFIGKPRGQQIAAMMEEMEREAESPGLSSGESEEVEKVEVAATTNVTLNQLLEQQKQLSEQISAWREQDF